MHERARQKRQHTRITVACTCILPWLLPMLTMPTRCIKHHAWAGNQINHLSVLAHCAFFRNASLAGITQHVNHKLDTDTTQQSSK